MSPSRRAFVLGGTAAAAAVPARAQTPASEAQGHHERSNQTLFATEMHERMRSMSSAMDRALMFGDPDRDFLAMMIPHHQGAIDMALLVLMHGQDPLTRQLAEEIIASQQAEIASMRARLKELEKRRTPDPDGFPALTGTRGVRRSPTPE